MPQLIEKFRKLPTTISSLKIFSQENWPIFIKLFMLLFILLIIFIHYTQSQSSDLLSSSSSPSSSTNAINAKASSSSSSSSLSSSHSMQYEYAVVIDAGSTGSRVHVYRFKRHPDDLLIDIDVRNEKYYKFKPGLSSFDKKNLKFNEIAQYFVPLLNFAREHVPAPLRSHTPLYLLATAGMRKVREQSPTMASTIMKMCTKELINSEFIVKEEWIRIIEGKHEGLWGWITANYLNGEIQNAVRLASPFQAQTRGVLEMGGESLQMTFIPTEKQLTKLPRQYLTKIEIGNIIFPIFTHSYMGLGMEAAQGRLDTYFSMTQNEKKIDEHPCYLRGDTRQSVAVHWPGKGDFEQCYRNLISLLDTTQCKMFEDLQENMFTCTPDGVPMPIISSSQPFYWIENFYYTARVLNIHSIDGNTFLDVLKEQGKSYCEMDKVSAVQKFPGASPEEITKTCFCAAWLAAMIDNGFNLREFKNYRVIRDINEVGIDWALGFLVEHSKDTAAEKSTPWAMIGLLSLASFGFVAYYFLKNPTRWSLIDRLKLLGKKQFNNNTRYSRVSTTEI